MYKNDARQRRLPVGMEACTRRVEILRAKIQLKRVELRQLEDELNRLIRSSGGGRELAERRRSECTGSFNCSPRLRRVPSVEDEIG